MRQVRLSRAPTHARAENLFEVSKGKPPVSFLFLLRPVPFPQLPDFSISTFSLSQVRRHQNMRVRYTLNQQGQFVDRSGNPPPEGISGKLVGMTLDISPELMLKSPAPLKRRVNYTSTIIVRMRAKEKCEQCGSTHRLQIHHRTYERWPGLEKPADLELLCFQCHRKTHVLLELAGKPLYRPTRHDGMPISQP